MLTETMQHTNWKSDPPTELNALGNHMIEYVASVQLEEESNLDAALVGVGINDQRPILGEPHTRSVIHPHMYQRWYQPWHTLKVF